MIVPDINVLVHAHNTLSPLHADARAWWEELLGGRSPVALPWVVMIGFIRITTHPRIFENPLRPDEACGHVDAWLAQPHVGVIHPGNRHGTILFDLLRRLGTAGDLTTDAHLAAIAIEHQAELHSTDADFARFSGLRWRNPLAE